MPTESDNSIYTLPDEGMTAGMIVYPTHGITINTDAELITARQKVQSLNNALTQCRKDVDGEYTLVWVDDEPQIVFQRVPPAVQENYSDENYSELRKPS